MPPTRTSAGPGFSPHRSPSLSSIPFKFRRKSLSEDELPPPDRALLFPSSPSRSPSLSMSMSSSPPSSPSAIATSPSRPNYLDTAAIRQPSSPLHPPVQHTYGYAHSYPRSGSHHSRYGYDLYSAEYLLKPFAPTSHAYGVVPAPSTSSGPSVYSLSPSEYDGSDLFHSSASNSGFHHDDDIEDAFGFALDMDDILGGSSPSRRVSFTTSSERDRPFVRPPAPLLMKPRAQTRAKKAPASTAAPVATPAPPENPRAMTVETDGSSTSIVRVSALPQEMPPRPSTPARPRTRLASPIVRAPAVAEDVDLDALPPSSPIASPLSSPLSSPVKSREQLLREEHTDGPLPPSSPIPIPRSPVREAEGDMDSLEFDLVPSPPSPSLDALRITSRIAVRALLNPSPDPVVVPVTLESAAEQAYQTVRDSSAKVETDGDVTPLVLGEAETSRVQAVMEEVTEDISVPTNTVDVPSASSAPLRIPSRASTPDCSALPDIPSSPLSSPPRSVADEHDIAVDLDIEVDIEVTEGHIGLPAPAATAVVAASREPSSTRDTSPQQDKVIHVPPHKTVKREDSVEAPTAASLTISKDEPLVQSPCVPIEGTIGSECQGTRDHLAKARSSETDQREERQRHKPPQKKRRRVVVWSDDETESDAPAPIPTPPSAPAPSQKRREKESERPRKRARDRGEKDRDQEKTKKARVKEAAAGVDVENEPLEAPRVHASHKVRPAKSSGAPKSATNMARPVPAAPHEPSSKVQLSPKRAREQEHECDYSDIPAYTLPLAAEELEGMLIETLATSRASSLSTSDLYGALMAARPALREMALPARVNTAPEPSAEEREREHEREAETAQKKGKGGGRRGANADADGASRRAWVPALEGVLERGWRRCGVFGKVVNSGTDTGNQALALEARWFYDPDRDEDEERATVVRSMMCRPGKRSETKKAKQYYWRPLPKISRWDPEDEL